MVRRGRGFLIGVAALAVAGCDTTVQEQLGIGRRAPDEFQVVRRAPLVIPPNYALRPPAPGTEAPSQSTSADAQALLTGRAATGRAAGQSEAEVALLGASPIQAQPDVRERLVDESGELASVADRTFLFILNFQKRQFEDDQTLDAAAESARLRGAGAPAPVVTTRTASTPLTVPPS